MFDTLIKLFHFKKRQQLASCADIPLVCHLVSLTAIFLGCHTMLHPKCCMTSPKKVDYEQSLFFLSPSNKTCENAQCEWLKVRDGKGMKKERLPAQPQRMIFHGLLIFWRDNYNLISHIQLKFCLLTSCHFTLSSQREPIYSGNVILLTKTNNGIYNTEHSQQTVGGQIWYPWKESTYCTCTSKQF